MGTRSNIIVHGADGLWRSIYCHFDGYLSGNGLCLYENYNSQEAADALVRLGDISSLGVDLNSTDAYSGWPDRHAGEYKPQIGLILQDVWEEKFGGTQYTYVWLTPLGEAQPKWMVGDPKHIDLLIKLEDALGGRAEVFASYETPWGGGISTIGSTDLADALI